MTFTEKLKMAGKKAKTAVVTGALALAAVASPAKAHEASPISEDLVEALEWKWLHVPSKVKVVKQTTDTAGDRKKAFERAVKFGAPTEEIVKYVDFPGFLPVTKDGQFDGKKAEDWGKKLAPYARAIAEKEGGLSAAEAYKAFKEKTGQKDVSFEDFEKIRELLSQAQEKNNVQKITQLPLLIAAMLAGFIVAGMGKELKTYLKNISKIESEDKPTKVEKAVALGMIVLGTAATLFFSKETIDLWKKAPAEQVPKIYAAAYDAYVSETIQAQRKQFKQLELQQVRELLQKGPK